MISVLMYSIVYLGFAANYSLWEKIVENGRSSSLACQSVIP